MGPTRTEVPYYNSLIPRPFSLLVLIAWSMVTGVGENPAWKFIKVMPA